MKYEDQGTSIAGNKHSKEQALQGTIYSGSKRIMEQPTSERKCTKYMQQVSQGIHLAGIEQRRVKTSQENSTHGTIVRGRCVPYK